MHSQFLPHLLTLLFLSPTPAIPMPQEPSQLPMSTKPTVYFGYGSNLWLHQMRVRCPTSKYVGVGRLDGYRWIINERGYADVVEVGESKEQDRLQKDSVSGFDTTENNDSDNQDITEETNNTPHVYGLIYTLLPADEHHLDKNEGVPIAYTKEHLRISFWAAPNDKTPVDVSQPANETLKMLVYIDRERVEESTPKKEYVYRMNRGIEDAVRLGVPKGYVGRVLRRFIGGDGEGVGEGEREKAERQARGFVDESGVF